MKSLRPYFMQNFFRGVILYPFLQSIQVAVRAERS